MNRPRGESIGEAFDGKTKHVQPDKSSEPFMSAEEFYDRNICPAFTCHVSGELPEDLRVMTRSQALKFATAYKEAYAEYLRAVTPKTL